MYDNIGKKIKTLTKVVTIVLICGCFIGFIIAGASAGNGGEGAAIGILLGAVSSLLIWVSSFFAYAFGELVDKVCDIEVNIRGSGSVDSKTEDKEDESNSERNQKLRVLLEKGLISEEEYRDIISE